MPIKKAPNKTSMKKDPKSLKMTSTASKKKPLQNISPTISEKTPIEKFKPNVTKMANFSRKSTGGKAPIKQTTANSVLYNGTDVEVKSYQQLVPDFYDLDNNQLKEERNNRNLFFGLATNYLGAQSAFGTAQPTFGTAQPTFGATQPTFGATQPTFGTAQPTFGATQPTFGATQPTFGATQPTFGATQPIFGTTQPYFGTAQPTFGTQQTFGTAQPTFGTAQPIFGATQPTFGTTQPTFGTQQTFGTAQPILEDTNNFWTITPKSTTNQSVATQSLSDDLSLADFNGGVLPSQYTSPTVQSYGPSIVKSPQTSPYKPAQISDLQLQSEKTIPTSTSGTSTTTKLLLLIALCYKKQYITVDEKSKLKDLALSHHELPNSALEVFEVDQDLEELADTFRRICKFS